MTGGSAPAPRKQEIVKAARYTCGRCGLCAPSPIVISTGVCSNKPACERRVNIAAATKAKKP